MFNMLSVVSCLTTSAFMWTTTSASTASVVPSSIFDFTVEDHNKNAVSLRSFRGKGAYLVVNVASQ